MDVVAVLTESADSQAYWRKLKQRLKAEGDETVTNCHALKMPASDGKMRLTDEWKRTGVKDSQYATLTDIITQEWSGFTTKQYKNFKGLKKENLRDNMTRMESALNTLAEVAATELSQKKNPSTFEQNKTVAKGGGHVAKIARDELEKQLGRSIVTRANAKGLKAPDEIPQIEGNNKEDQ